MAYLPWVKIMDIVVRGADAQQTIKELQADRYGIQRDSHGIGRCSYGCFMDNLRIESVVYRLMPVVDLSLIHI